MNRFAKKAAPPASSASSQSATPNPSGSGAAPGLSSPAQAKATQQAITPQSISSPLRPGFAAPKARLIKNSLRAELLSRKPLPALGSPSLRAALSALGEEIRAHTRASSQKVTAQGLAHSKTAGIARATAGGAEAAAALDSAFAKRPRLGQLAVRLPSTVVSVNAGVQRRVRVGYLTERKEGGPPVYLATPEEVMRAAYPLRLQFSYQEPVSR